MRLPSFSLTLAMTILPLQIFSNSIPGSQGLQVTSSTSSSPTTGRLSFKELQPQQQQQQQQQHLVLLGGGHAHAQVIRALHSKARPSCLTVTVIDLQRSACYSGMVPGCISQLYSPEDTLLHLEPLCEWADIQFINDEVIDIDLEHKYLILKHSQQQQQQQISFDALSIDIGSTCKGIDNIPGATKYSIPTRPISNLLHRIQHAEQSFNDDDDDDDHDELTNTHVIVVGAGAAGIELAMSIVARWRPLLGTRLQVTLLDTGITLLPNESTACQDAVKQVLTTRGVEVRHKCHVLHLTSSHIHLDTGDTLEYTHCLWATGAAAHPLAQTLLTRGLAVHPQGWIQVNQHLQSLSHPFVFAAGDCSNIQGLPDGPPPKAGVYAVRAGPILIDNLTAFLQQKPLIKYKPQNDFLKLMVCGDGTALGFRFGHPIYGRWVMQMKDHIDQMFMSLFKKDNLPCLDEKVTYDTSQYDDSDNSGRTRLQPQAAADLLQRTDDTVDYLVAWNVLQDMTKDEHYQQKVLARMEYAAVGIQ